MDERKAHIVADALEAWMDAYVIAREPLADCAEALRAMQLKKEFIRVLTDA